MKVAVNRERVLAMALALAALMLLAVLLWDLNLGKHLQLELLKMRNIPVVAPKPLNILPEFALPPEETGFPELISRSLFSINRRSAAAAKGGAASMKKGQFVLVGVVITPQRSAVQLRDVQTKKAETVALNGVVRGMTVGEVEPSRVVLRQGAESEELVLNVQAGPGRAVVARTSPQTPAVPPPAAAAVQTAPPPSTVASAPVRAASGAIPPVSGPDAPTSGVNSRKQ